MRGPTGYVLIGALFILAPLARGQDVNLEFYSEKSHVMLPLYMVSASDKVKRLHAGMARVDVMKLMGRADWVIRQEDRGPFTLRNENVYQELHWRNPGCASVLVQFDRSGRVIAWDDGDLCYSSAEALSPTRRYSCSQADRGKYCE